MSEPSTNPIVIFLFMIGRCLLPVGVLLGISYLLRKFGLVVIEAPNDPNEGKEESAKDQNSEGETR